MKTLILTTFLVTIGLVPLAYGEEEMDAMPVGERPKGCAGQILIRPDRPVGPIRTLNAVNGAPFTRGGRGDVHFEAWKAAEIPYARLHDINLHYQYGAPFIVDVPWIFRNFDADENDPKSYDFAGTDALLKRIQDGGTKVFYRLSAAFEANLVRKYTIYPPKDYAKWARVCEHIIAHYTEGWADGFKWDIEYWEIWNEPNHKTEKDGPNEGSFWRGTRDQFKELFKTVLIHLKGRFPHLKIGGPAMAGWGGEWGKEIVREFAAAKVPLDFYSWHCYATSPSNFVDNARWVRQMLDENGYERTESVFDEWNYVKNFREDYRYSVEVEQGRYNQKCAAFIAASMSALQNERVDLAMFYDAFAGSDMNSLFDPVTSLPMRAYYPFVVWRDLRRLGTQVAATSDLKDVYVTAAKDAKGRLGVLVVRYSEDNNVTASISVALRRIGGEWPKSVRCHITDDVRIHTGWTLDREADGAIVLTMRPCSFAFLETE